jgi:GT2 family glycosyltransferase
MAVYISVVSHGHANIIRNLNCVKALCDDFIVIIKSNVPNEDFGTLQSKRNFHLIDSDYYLGFGRNNNLIFDYCCTKLDMNADDYFIVLNPDVLISADDVNRLVERMRQDVVKLSAISLFRDNELSIHDNSVRHFPSFNQFVKSFLGLGNTSIIDKENLNKACQVDWAAGSFLATKAEHYRSLGGFDESYFMYCEDIDICYRSSVAGEAVTFYPDIKAVHLAQHANRKMLSKHFYWHLSSAIRFLFTKYGWTKPKSSLMIGKSLGNLK